MEMKSLAVNKKPEKTVRMKEEGLI